MIENYEKKIPLLKRDRKQWSDFGWPLQVYLILLAFHFLSIFVKNIPLSFFLILESMLIYLSFSLPKTNYTFSEQECNFKQNRVYFLFMYCFIQTILDYPMQLKEHKKIRYANSALLPRKGKVQDERFKSKAKRA